MGVIFSAALFTGMGSLFESGKQAAVEHARAEYGDWHYNTRGDLAWIKNFEKEDQGRGYKIEKTGMETIRKVLEEPFKMQLVYADSSYLEMMGRKILQGYYPQTEQEIAMDMQTLQSLGMEDKLGEQVVLDGDTFAVCGILSDMPEKLQEAQGNFNQVFVNASLDYGENGSFLYLKFDENHTLYQ